MTAARRTDPRSPSPERAPRPQRNGFGTLGAAMSAYLQASGLGLSLREGRVFRAFESAAGPLLAKRARPARLERGELLVEVQSSAHLHELAGFAGEDLRRRANEILGREEIRRIVFKQKR
jgi:hypothetical protein